MIIEERLRTFINSLDRGNAEWLDEVERQALSDRVPIVRKEMQGLLRFLLAAKRPRAILEVGTAVGFSALLMSEYMPDGCRITTIENEEKRIAMARENIRRAGREDRITDLSGPFDFIFMDAAKGQYLSFFPEVLRLLCPGGLLVSDNVLQDGDLLESRYAVRRRDRTIHARMREYLYELTHHPDLETAVLPVADGVTVSVRRTV